MIKGLLDDISNYRDNREFYTKSERKQIRKSLRDKIREVPNNTLSLMDQINNN